MENIHPLTLLTFGVMLCMTIVAITNIIVTPTVPIDTTRSAGASNTVANAAGNPATSTPAGHDHAAMLKAMAATTGNTAPSGRGCGMDAGGGGCGCGGMN